MHACTTFTMAGLRVLITGGAGFVGQAIVERIARTRNWHMAVLDIQKIIPSTLLERNVDYYSIDVRDADAVLEAVRSCQPQVIIHTANIVPQGLERYSRIGAERIHSVNVNGTRNILEAARMTGVQALVYTSSVQVIGDDLTQQCANMNEDTPVPSKSLVYGETKVHIEDMGREVVADMS